MKKNRLLPLNTIAGFVSAMNAQMPIVQTKYTADPAPMVLGDTIYLYTSHDEDNAGVHDVYFVFRGSKKQNKNLMDFDSWEFSK